MMRPSPPPPPQRSSRLRRSQQQRHQQHHMWNRQRLLLLAAGVFCLGSFSLLPILVLESIEMEHSSSSNNSNGKPAVSVDRLMDLARHVRHPSNQAEQHDHQPPAAAAAAVDGPQPATDDDKKQKNSDAKKDDKEAVAVIHHHPQPKPAFTLADLQPDAADFRTQQTVARGVAGRPMDQTPAMAGAHRAHIECADLNVDATAYWNDPQGTRDESYQSPFSDTAEDDEADDNSVVKYISFAPDRGGWNNLRMSMEIIFVIAAATGRTLILPPKEPLYLLHHDKAARHRGFADFFPIHTDKFQKRVKVISFADFVAKESGSRFPVPANLTEAINNKNVADHCDKREKSKTACRSVFEYLGSVGHNAEMSAVDTCLVFDKDRYHGNEPPQQIQEHIQQRCGSKRNIVYWDVDNYAQHDLVHFRASDKHYRLLTHFYGMIHFSDPVDSHYFKRFVRDFLHYHDSIYCAAGKIVKAVQAEGVQRGFEPDREGAGGYSALHVRRGDLQYKRVKIPAAEWYENTKHVWQPNEILYVATDERNKTFFDDLAVHHDLRFLDDYWDLAGLGDLDPNYMGMIDTIVASRGRAFAGTWFSTFSGYINRLRGYHGMSMQDSWYSFLPKKTAVHEWKLVNDFAYAYEWPDGWIGIDADEWPTRDKF